MPDHWADELAQESKRARSLAQRGMLVAGTSSVTVAVLLQSLGVLVAPTVAASTNAKYTLLLALLSFVFAVVFGAFANATGPAESGGVYGKADAQLTAALAAARGHNERNTTVLSYGVAAEVIGMVSIALTAVLYVFNW